MQAVQFSLTNDKNGLGSKHVVSNNDSSSNSVSNAPEPIPVTQRDSEVTASVYFAVQLPPAARDKSLDQQFVFTSRVEALKTAKAFPGSRFKSFTSLQEAEEYANALPVEVPPPSSSKDTLSKESSAYRTPKTAELLEFRRLIEFADVTKAKNLVWTNPRLLVGSGDNPTIVQEGFHYNALHVTAMKNKPEHAKLILNTLEDTQFWHLLYPEDTSQSRAARIRFATDLYVNMPEKGNSETALHFACKFGFVDVVEVLVRHPLTDKQRLNKFGQTAAEVICQRMKNPDRSLVDRMTALFEDVCFVPLLRAPDNSVPPCIAPVLEGPQPISGQGHNEGHGPDPNMKIWAVAGPMTPRKAELFRQSWMLSPSAKRSDARQLREIKCSDSEKGWERVGRYLAAELQVPWRESWPFLNVFDDLRQDQCLDRLEAYLERHSQQLADKHSSQQQSDMSVLANLMGDLCLHDDSAFPATPPSSPTPSRRVSIDDQAEPWPEFSASQLAELDATFNDDVTNMLTSVSEVISRSRRNSDRGTEVESSGESFHTARDSDDGEGQAVFVDLSQSLLDLPDIYLEGHEPSKLDMDVYNVLEGVELSPARHPLTCRWRNLVAAADPATRTKWSTPRKVQDPRSILDSDFASPPLNLNDSVANESFSPLNASQRVS